MPGKFPPAMCSPALISQGRCSEEQAGMRHPRHNSSLAFGGVPKVRLETSANKEPLSSNHTGIVGGHRRVR
jgi:hypothetical protein